MLLIGIYLFYENWSIETFGTKVGLGLLSGNGNSVLFRGPLIIPISSLLRKQESSDFRRFWIPGFPGMTFLEVSFSHGLLSHKAHNKAVTSNFILKSRIPNFMTGRSCSHRAYRGILIPPMWSVARKESWQDFFVIHPKPKANERVNQAKQKDLPFPSWLPLTKKPQGQACNNAIFVSIGRWRRFQGNLEKSSSN